MSPVEQHGAHLDVAQPSLPAGPGCTGDEPGVASPAGGNRPVEDASRRHVLPRGGENEDPGAPAHQAGLGPFEDGYIVAGPVQERRHRASGDRSPIMPTLMPLAPEPLRAPPGEVTAIRQRSSTPCSQRPFGRVTVVSNDPAQPWIGTFSGEESVDPRKQLLAHRRIRE
jgi:hypothetical protein